VFLPVEWAGARVEQRLPGEKGLKLKNRNTETRHQSMAVA
jgi:hypothetical protein